MKLSHEKIWLRLFAFYLFFYSAFMILYRQETWGDSGIFPYVSLQETLYEGLDFIPKLLHPFFSFSSGLILLLVICFSSAFIFFQRAISTFALLIFFCQWLLLLRNPLTNSPEFALVQWLLLTLAFGYEKGSIRKDYRMAAWFILALSYTYAGWSKILHGDAPWHDGSAIWQILNNSSARMLWYGNFFQASSALASLSWPITWGAVILQAFSFLFLSTNFLRFFWLTAVGSAHLVFLFFLDLHQLTLGMLLFHLFLWDPEWTKYFQFKVRQH